jgi:hypothetical protein
MFIDPIRRNVWDDLRQQDVRAFARWLTPATLTEAAARAWVRSGCSPLCLFNLVWLALAAALQPGLNFANILTATLKLLEDNEAFAHTAIGRAKQKAAKQPSRRQSKHDPRRDDPTQVSEEAFVQARQRVPVRFWVALLNVLTEQFQAEHADRLRCYGFRLLAIDGTCLDLFDSAANRQHFGTARNARGSHRPQARMTMLQMPLTRMPLRYELEPLAVGEVTMAGRLAEAVGAGDLVLLDAGYWSYGLFWRLAHQHACFAIRLRQGPKFKTLRRLGPKETLVRWTPKDSRGQWRALGLPKSMELRVIRYRVPGYRPTAIVTNVLDPARLSREDWVRLAVEADEEGRLLPGVYQRRWEIETTWRELKVEQGMNDLRSRTPGSVAFEVAGHVLLYLLVRWLIVEAATAHGVDPLRLSFVEALRELEQMRVSLLYASPRWAVEVLLPRLLERIASHRVPQQPGRSFERHKKAKPNKRRRKTKNRQQTPTPRNHSKNTGKRKAKA